MAIRRETELYEPVKHFLEQLGYEVKGEVHSCDVVAFKQDDDVPIIVELKKTFNLSLIYQGIERLKLSDRVYLAVERTDDARRNRGKKWRDPIRLCRMLGLGLITVRFYRSRKPRVEILCEAEPYVPKKQKRSLKRLEEEFRGRSDQDYNQGGSTKTKLVTVYREKALEIAYYLHTKGPLRPRDLRELTQFTDAYDIVYRNYYGWFERVGPGRYAITPLGVEALEQFKHVIDHMLRSNELDPAD